MKEVSFITNNGMAGDVVPLFAGKENCAPSHSFGPQMREYYIIHYCVSGKGTFTVGGTGYEVGAGEIFMIRPGEVVSYVADERDPWTYVWISFSGDGADALLPPADTAPFPYPTFLRIGECVSAGENAAAIYLSFLYEIAYHLLPVEKEAAADVCNRVKQYIDLGYMENLEVEQIALSFGFDRRYLSRRFKYEFGTSIKEYLTKVRIERAEGFLSEGFSVADVAVMVGYTDSFGFSRMFKKITGHSPSSVKK